MPRYIDAELLESKYRTGTDPQDPYSDITYLLPEDIESIPTADVQEVRHSWWYENNIGDAVCSNCKCIQNKNEVVFMPYCSRCGAKMDGVDNNVSTIAVKSNEGWISVKNKLPEDNSDVLVICRETKWNYYDEAYHDCIRVGWYDAPIEEWRLYNRTGSYVRHHSMFGC